MVIRSKAIHVNTKCKWLFLSWLLVISLPKTDANTKYKQESCPALSPANTHQHIPLTRTLQDTNNPLLSFEEYYTNETSNMKRIWFTSLSTTDPFSTDTVLVPGTILHISTEKRWFCALAPKPADPKDLVTLESLDGKRVLYNVKIYVAHNLSWHFYF